VDPQARLQHALDIASRHLGQRDRTVAEIRRHLQHRRVEPDTIDAAVAELQEQGYLDDTRFARLFAEDRRTLDGWGNDRIERRLRVLGIVPEDADAALTRQSREEELAAALALLRRRYPVAPESDRDCQRALGFLVRKGYALELAHDAIRACRQAA
jgi:regulatory protein